jgi:hypothetical protein
MEQFKYEIGDKTYIQRPLRLGQVNALSKIIKHIVFPEEMNPVALMIAFGDLLPKAIAIVLLEEEAVSGKSTAELKEYLKSRNIDILADEIEWSVDVITNVKVIEDFFDCNPTASLFEKFAGLTEKFSSLISRKKTSSIPSVSSSPAEISPSETTSSGASPLPSADRT